MKEWGSTKTLEFDPYQNHRAVEEFLSAMATSPVVHTAILETSQRLLGRVIARFVMAPGLKMHTFLTNRGTAGGDLSSSRQVDNC